MSRSESQQYEARAQILRAHLLPLAEFAERMHVSARTVRMWIAQRTINHVKAGPVPLNHTGLDRRRVLVPETEIERLLEPVPRIP